MRAQMWSMDFVISAVMFFVSVVLILFAWNYVTTENYEQMVFNDMQNTGLIVSDVLVRTEGSPPDWNTTALAIGLASDDNVIDENKLRNFMDYMSYNESKRIMGIRNFEYYFTMKNLDNITIQMDGKNIEKGYPPSIDVNTIVPIQRYALFQEKIAKIEFTLWI